MNHARLVQSLGWLAFLALLILSGSFSSYIASWQRGVLFTAGALFALLVLCDALFNRPGADQHHGHDHDHEHHDHAAAAERPWLNTAMHLLPLFLFLAVGTTTLGSQAVTSLAHPLPGTARGVTAATSDDRPVGMAKASAGPAPAAAAPAVSTPGEPPAAPAAGPAAPSPAADPLVADARPAEDQALAPVAPTASLSPGKPVGPPGAEAPTPLNLLDLYYPAQHVGVTRVQVVGRLMLPTPDDLKHLPPDVDPKDLKVLAYRYLVTCCAADAQPVISILKNQPLDGLKADDWVTITGQWLPPKGLGDMSAIVVEKLEPAAAPKDPFLHPVWR
jgi:uncharacterized membrane protein YcgQ (UPF0703/DUF1980 family)